MTAAVPPIDYTTLHLGKELGKGGQGSVIAVDGFPINGRWTAALKRYSPSIAPSVDVAALQTITIFPGTLSAHEKLWLDENTAWPAVIVKDSGSVCGFLMRTVPQAYYFDFRTPDRENNAEAGHDGVPSQRRPVHNQSGPISNQPAADCAAAEPGGDVVSATWPGSSGG